MKDYFTNIIHNRGWTVRAACERWGVDYENFRRSCRNENVNFRVRLADQCRGLEDKNNVQP